MITLHIDDDDKKEKHLLLDDSTGAIAIMDNVTDDESWVYLISKVLSDHPLEWNEYIEKKHHYSIIKKEFDELTQIKTQLESKKTEECKEKYKEKLIDVASACILTLMNV